MRFYTRVNEQNCIETFCCIRTGKIAIVGNSKQNPQDEHNEYIGRKVAVTRAINSQSSKEHRTQLWQYFHKHYPKPTGKPQGAKPEINETHLKSVRKMLKDGSCAVISCYTGVCPFGNDFVSCSVKFNNTCPSHPKYNKNLIPACKKWLADRGLEE
jgi:hypothetical protein